MSSVELSASIRSALGRKVKALRRDGIIPANIVSRGKESISIEADYNTLEKVLNEAGFTQPININVGDSKKLVLTKIVDRDPSKNRISHVTFQEIIRGEKVEAEVPLRFIGNSSAEQAGNFVLLVEDTVLVEAEATNIPEHLDIDKSPLTEPEDVIHASDIIIPTGVELKTDPETVVAKVEAPRANTEEVTEEVAEQPPVTNGQADKQD